MYPSRPDQPEKTNAGLPQLPRRYAGQVIERGLRGAVHAPGWICFNCRVRRNIDDHTCLSQNQWTDHSLYEPKRADGVDLQRPFKIFAVRIRNQPQGNGAERARIVDQYVYRPGQGRRLTNYGIDALLFADISDVCECDSAHFL